MHNLPPLLQTTDWPTSDQGHKLAELVRARLESGDGQGRARPRAAGEPRLLASLRQEAALPPPGNPATLKVFPPELPQSLGDGFIGRADDLWRIHFTLSTLRGVAATGAALSAALHAAGGFGKTRLAAEYLWRFGPTHYPGGLFWVDADASEDRLIERLHGILGTLRPTTPSLADFLKAGRDARRELADAFQDLPGDQPVLYVLDNVPEPPPGQSPKPVRHWCPALGRVTLLATSRLRLAGDASIRALPVDVLTPEGAVLLLTRGLDRTAIPDSAWQRLADWVGCLPLALELLNGALALGSLAPHEIWPRLERAGVARELDEQMQALRDHVPEGALRGITEALLVSYDRLTAAQQHAARLLALLAPEAIPDRLLETFGGRFTPAVKAGLRARAFVTPVSGAEVPMFGRMHRVLADFLRAHSPDGPAELSEACEALLAALPPDEARDPERWRELNTLVAHAECVLERSHGLPGEAHAASTVQLALQLAILLREQGLYASAEHQERAALDLARGALGAEHPDTLTVMGNLAQTLKARGDFSGARELETQVLAALERQCGPEHADTLLAMGNLAVTIGAGGDLAQARDLQERLLAIRERLHTSEDERTLGAATNLAATRYALGDLAGARALQERVLEARERLLGPEHPDTLSAMHNLAQMLGALGDLASARELRERVLAGRRRLLGPEHPRTLSAMDSLAATRFRQGDLTGVRELQTQVLVARERVLGPEHPDTLTAMNNLAQTLVQLDELSGARELQEQVLARRAKLLGEEHPATLRAMGNLAQTLSSQGDLSRARTLQESELAASERLLGTDHPDTLRATGNLAQTRKAQGDIPGARRMQECVLAASRRLFGLHHPGTTVAAWHLLKTLLALDEPAATEALLSQSLDWLAGADPQRLSREQQEIKQILVETGRWS
jgi:tetratricopeptide (TPR) repeat protein